VGEIFRKTVPVHNYGLLESGSVRNSLLAHYMIENLPYGAVVGYLSDKREITVPKMVLADVYFEYNEQSLWSGKAAQGVKGGLGTCFKNTSIDKIATIVGLRMFHTLFYNPEGRTEKARVQQHDISSLRNEPDVVGISEGADPEHAAWC
jgi:hypothetical protein